MELTGFIGKVTLPSLGPSKCQYENGILSIQGIPDRNTALLLLDCLEGLAAAQGRKDVPSRLIKAQTSDQAHDPGVKTEKTTQTGNSGLDEDRSKPAIAAPIAQEANSPNDHALDPTESVQGGNTPAMDNKPTKEQRSKKVNVTSHGQTGGITAAAVVAPEDDPMFDYLKGTGQGMKSQTGNSKKDTPTGAVSESEKSEDPPASLPESITSATTLRPIITYLRNEENLLNTDSIVKRLEQLKEVVPYLHRTKNLSQRVPRTLAAIEAG